MEYFILNKVSNMYYKIQIIFVGFWPLERVFVMFENLINQQNLKKMEIEKLY